LVGLRIGAKARGRHRRRVKRIGQMSQDSRLDEELRAKVGLTKNEIVHLWNGGVLSLKVEGRGVEADLELRCSEVQQERGTRILIKRVSAD